MQAECSFPVAISYSPAVLGPFTAVECLTLTAFLPVDFLVYMLSHFAACIISPAFLVLSLFLVFYERRGERPFELIKAFIEYRLSGSNPRTAISKAVQSVDRTRSVYRVENLNYACALSAEKEAFLDAFLSFCLSARGCIRFMAIPEIDDGTPRGTDVHASAGETAGLRSFYLSATEDQALPVFNAGTSSSVTPSDDPSGMHPLLDTGLLRRVLQ